MRFPVSCESAAAFEERLVARAPWKRQLYFSRASATVACPAPPRTTSSASYDNTLCTKRTPPSVAQTPSTRERGQSKPKHRGVRKKRSMARLASLTHDAPPAGASSPERGAAELSQLLRRLDQTILHADRDRERRLRASEFERARLISVGDLSPGPPIVWTPVVSCRRMASLFKFTVLIACHPESRIRPRPPDPRRAGNVPRQDALAQTGHAGRPEPQAGAVGEVG